MSLYYDNANQIIQAYFGDYLLGLFVTFSSTPSATFAGSTDISITLQMNLRAKLHVYGYAGTISSVADYTADVADDWDYFQSYQESDDPTTAPTGTKYTDESELYHMYIAWSNPDSSAAVTIDGIEVKAYAEVTPNSSWSTATTEAELTAAPPTIEVKLQDNSVDTKRFDIHPGSSYAASDAVEDVSKGGTENITLGTGITAMSTDICSEKWYLSSTAIACVEMTTTVERKRNTADVDHDIILNYSDTYNMHAMIGLVADTTDEALKFSDQDVDFSNFYSGAVNSLALGSALACTIGLALTF